MYLKWTHEQCMYCAHFSALYCAHYLQTLQIVLLIQTIHEFLPAFVFVGDINGCYIYSSNALVVSWEPHLRAVETGCLVYETCHADIALTEYNQYTNTHVFKIQIQMYSKYKYNCIVHANTNQFTICGLGRRFMGPDMLTLPWQKSNGSIRVHKNTNTWKPKEKQLLLQIQIMHCPVELLLLQNGVGWIRCIVVWD